MLETKYKYFIEDVETNEWYHYPFALIPMTHTFGKGWDKPFPLNEEFWTKDPQQAFSWFNSKEDAQKFLDDMFKRDDLTLYKGNFGYEKRKLIITEHEFISK